MGVIHYMGYLFQEIQCKTLMLNSTLDASHKPYYLVKWNIWSIPPEFHWSVYCAWVFLDSHWPWEQRFGTGIIYLGYRFCGWIVLGPCHIIKLGLIFVFGVLPLNHTGAGVNRKRRLNWENLFYYHNHCLAVSFGTQYQSACSPWPTEMTHPI